MRGLRRVSASIAATVLATAGVIATASAADASTGIGSCSAQGDYATCVASGTATEPVTLTVSVTSSPDQDVSVAWSDVCSQGTGAGSASGSFTAQTPVSRTVSHPYSRPDSCILSADAQLQVGGNSINVSLSYSQTAAPAPVSHEIKGYGGKCADDNGNSSALRTKIQIWSCVNDASQQWSYSGGELKHGSACMNDQGNGGSGTKVILWSCNGAANEVWTHNAKGEYVEKANGGKLCLDDPAYSTRNGTQLDVYTCKGGSNQRWSLP
jgi:Ricin-type beta-trefoil lectin domain